MCNLAFVPIVTATQSPLWDAHCDETMDITENCCESLTEVPDCTKKHEKKLMKTKK
jgi:hypothetical protein